MRRQRAIFYKTACSRPASSTEGCIEIRVHRYTQREDAASALNPALSLSHADFTHLMVAGSDSGCGGEGKSHRRAVRRDF